MSHFEANNDIRESRMQLLKKNLADQQAAIMSLAVVRTSHPCWQAIPEPGGSWMRSLSHGLERGKIRMCL